jgi:hypothetical protein
LKGLIIASRFFMGVKVVASDQFSIGFVVENQKAPWQRKRRFLVALFQSQAQRRTMEHASKLSEGR